jgi:hypothetical protein
MSYHFNDPTAEDFDQVPLADEDRRQIKKAFNRITVIAWSLVLVATIIYLKLSIWKS